MRYRYLMNKHNGAVGIADLPDFVDFDEKPPRSFDMWSNSLNRMVMVSTESYVEITKEVYDLMRSMEYDNIN